MCDVCDIKWICANIWKTYICKRYMESLNVLGVVRDPGRRSLSWPAYTHPPGYSPRSPKVQRQSQWDRVDRVGGSARSQGGWCSGGSVDPEKPRAPGTPGDWLSLSLRGRGVAWRGLAWLGRERGGARRGPEPGRGGEGAGRTATWRGAGIKQRGAASRPSWSFLATQRPGQPPRGAASPPAPALRRISASLPAVRQPHPAQSTPATESHEPSRSRRAIQLRVRWRRVYDPGGGVGPWPAAWPCLGEAAEEGQRGVSCLPACPCSSGMSVSSLVSVSPLHVRGLRLWYKPQRLCCPGLSCCPRPRAVLGSHSPAPGREGSESVGRHEAERRVCERACMSDMSTKRIMLNVSVLTRLRPDSEPDPWVCDLACGVKLSWPCRVHRVAPNSNWKPFLNCLGLLKRGCRMNTGH